MTLIHRSWLVALAAVIFGLPVAAMADETPAPAEQAAEQVELFSAMQKGLVEVKMIQSSAKRALVTVTNKSDKPLEVKIPETFAGVPVVGQGGWDPGGFGPGGGMDGGFGMEGGFGGFGDEMGGFGGGSSYGSSSDNNSSQSTGSGGGYGNNNNSWSIPVNDSVAREFKTVCLEHGKKDPDATMRYAIRPLETVTKNPAVANVCATLGEGKVSQEVAQMAAWNLNNGVSFRELAAKKNTARNGISTPVFAPNKVREAMAFTQFCVKKAKADMAKTKKQPRESLSMAD